MKNAERVKRKAAFLKVPKEVRDFVKERYRTWGKPIRQSLKVREKAFRTIWGMISLYKIESVKNGTTLKVGSSLKRTSLDWLIDHGVEVTIVGGTTKHQSCSSRSIKRTYKISAEHVNGQSLAAMTNNGVVSDPTTMLPDSVQADTRHNAELAAMRIMQEYANEQGLLLTEEWWNSQVVTVEVPKTHWLILFSDAAGWTVLRDSTETDEIMTFASKEEAEAQAKIEEADYRDAYDHHSPEELEEIVPEYKVISNQCDFSYHDEGAQT
jgi:hypothetical protein